MEWVVIPWFFIKILGLSGEALKFIAGIWATAEMYYWWWFSGWVILWSTKTDPVKKAINIGKEVIDTGRKITPSLKNTKIFKMIEDWIQDHLVDKFKPENYKYRKLYKTILGLGYIASCVLLFCLGTIPLPLFWIIGLVACRASNWRIGFLFLAMGNLFKNAYLFTLGWERIFSLF